jgi:hypothetical protein
MPAKKPIPADAPSEDLVLAAIDRAYRHRTNRQNPGVLFVDVKEHLGLPRSGSATLRLRPIWQTLQTLGLVEHSCRGNRVQWRLTVAGHKRLQAARRNSQLLLPESPQHQRWRHATPPPASGSTLSATTCVPSLPTPYARSTRTPTRTRTPGTNSASASKPHPHGWHQQPTV